MSERRLLIAVPHVRSYLRHRTPSHRAKWRAFLFRALACGTSEWSADFLHHCLRTIRDIELDPTARQTDRARRQGRCSTPSTS